MRRWAPPVALVAVIVVVWEAYGRLGGVSPTILPAPSRIIGALWQFRADAVRHLVPTLVEAASGFSIAGVLAAVTAIAMDRFVSVRRAIAPLLVASQTIPVVAIAPLLLLWFGFGIEPKVLIVVLVTFFPITVALLDGFGSAEGEATDLMRSYGASDGQVLRKLRWPAALPSLFTGARIAVTYAVIGAVFGEYVGAYEGLGIWMQTSQNAFRTDLVFGAILLVSVLSICLYAVVTALERLLIPWYRASRATQPPR
jgi:NitT/TauT family transport system permease protein